MADYDNLDSTFRQKLMDLVAASGGRVYISSGYRSTAEQQALWDEAVQVHGDEARNWVAPPGNSNHEKGFAADLGGDTDWAQQHAAEFGLSFPMSWEPWHVEPVGLREASGDDAYTPDPSLAGAAQDPATTATSDPMMVLAGLLGMDAGGSSSLFNSVALPSTSRSLLPPTALAQLRTPTRPVPPPLTLTRNPTSGDDMTRFMAAIRSKESGGDYVATGTPTQWGRATGAYQFLDSTWANYRGYARASDAPPAIQDEKARSLMGEYYNQFGNWADVAAAWYGGPGADSTSPEIANYSNDVLGRMYG